MSGKFRIVEHLEEKNCGVSGKPPCCVDNDKIPQCQTVKDPVTGVETKASDNCMILSAKPTTVSSAKLKLLLKKTTGLLTETESQGIKPSVTATLYNPKCGCPEGKSPSIKTLRHSSGEWERAHGSLECK
jgi:hypothetical protein